jgi:hypothetical protein
VYSWCIVVYSLTNFYLFSYFTSICLREYPKHEKLYTTIHPHSIAVSIAVSKYAMDYINGLQWNIIMIVKKIFVGKKEPVLKVPVPKPVSQKNILHKILEVVKEDQHNLVMNIKAVTSDTPPEWEEYKRFIKLSKKGEVR